MGSLTDTYENILLDAILGDGHAAGFPATVYLALFTANPTEAGVQTAEVATGSYVRKAIANTTAQWPNASGSTKANAVAQTMVTATGNWGTITHVGLMSASSAGSMIAYAALSTPTPVNSGETAVFAVGSLVFTSD